MSDNKKFILYSLGIYLVYSILLLILGYFKIGLLSDDYLNFYDALNSTFYDKITGNLPFTSAFHIRPVYYLSLEKSIIINDWLGFAYDNFVLFRIQNLVLFIIISFLTGNIVLYLTKRMSIALIASLTILIFPNNINNICWTAARVDLICCMFYLLTIYSFLIYAKFKTNIYFILTVLFCIIALLTKELAVTLPFTALLFAYFLHGKEGLKQTRILLITLFSLFGLYFIYRILILGNNITEIATIYQENPLSNAPGVFARGLISLTIPLDYLTLNYALRNDNKIILLYLLSLYGALFYMIWVMIKIDVYKYVGQILILTFLLLFPYAIIGYIRPQMILLPFIIITIYMLWVYDKQRNFNIHLNKKVLRIFYTVCIIFWGYWGMVVVQDWGTSYEKASVSMDNLQKISLEHDKQIIIIGNPGRFKQTLMFDKLTGAYNFWKEKKYTIKVIINDIVQTAVLEENSIGASMEYKILLPNEFEIKATSPKQFFYIEGFDNERIKTGFENKDMSVEFLEFNNINKPIKMKLKILSQNTACYLANNLNFVRIY